MLKTKKRKKTRVGKVTGTVRKVGQDMSELRREVYYRANACCELQISPKCWKTAWWEHGHLAHIKSKGSGGGDTAENTRWSCPPCHLYEHSGGKVVPPKPRVEE